MLLLEQLFISIFIYKFPFIVKSNYKNAVVVSMILKATLLPL